MNSADQIRHALEETPSGARLFLVLRSGEHLNCTSTWMLDGAEVIVYVGGEPRAIGLDQVEHVGQLVVSRAAALVAA